MKDIEKLISPLIEQQFPSLYREEGETFIAFVKAYFQWMEETNNVLYDARRLPEYRDIDTTVDRFIEEFRKKYMYGIPKDAAIDKKLLQKHIKELYTSKGTTQGIKLLFRLLYNEDVDVYLPGDDVLKASDGRWVIPKYLEMEYDKNLSMYVGKIITGRISGAQAYVKDYQSFYVDSRRHDVLYIEDLTKDFLATEEIINQEVIDDLGIDLIQSPRILGSMSSIQIISSEPGFTLGEIVTVGDSGFSGKAIVTGVKKLNGTVDFLLNSGGDGYRLTSNVIVTPAGTPNASFSVGSITTTGSIDLTTVSISGALSTSFDAATYAFASNTSANSGTPVADAFDFTSYTYGIIDSITNINPGEGYTANATVVVEDPLIYPLRIPDGSGGYLGRNANISGIAGFGSGAVANVVVYDSGIGYSNGVTVTLISSTNTSIQAVGKVVSSKQGSGAGYFSDTKGFLNADKFIHDNYFYQDYSYQVRANVALNKYAGVLRDLWHPSGTERFGRTVFKDEYKTRGTTVEALIDWLTRLEVSVSTTRFTDTSRTTTFTTEYLTTLVKGTQRQTSRSTTFSTTYETAISVLTTFDTITGIDIATAFLETRDTTYYTSTTVNTLVVTNTDTFVSTKKTYDTATSISTAYATVTSKSTTTTYDTSSALGSTTAITSTTYGEDTTILTSTAKQTQTTFVTSYNTQSSYFESVRGDGFNSIAAALQAARDAGYTQEQGWVCEVEDTYAGEWSYVCSRTVSIDKLTSATTSKSTITTALTSTTYVADTTVSTSTIFDTLAAKSTSRSTSTAYATDTTIATFRLTSTSTNVDTGYNTKTSFTRATTFDTLPSRITSTTRISEFATSFVTSFDTKYEIDVGTAVIETSVGTSRTTTIITGTEIDTSTSTDYATVYATQYRTIRYTNTLVATSTSIYTQASTSITNDTATVFDTSTLFDTTNDTNLRKETSITTSKVTSTSISTDTVFSTQTTRSTSFVNPIDTISMVANATTNGASITIPAAAQAGDVAVLFAYARGGGAYSGNTISGWTTIANNRTEGTSSAVWGHVQYKILTSGDPGTAVGTIQGGQEDASYMLIFRPSTAVSSITLSAVNGYANSSNPPAQIISASETPYVAFAQYIASSAVSPRTSNVVMTEVSTATSDNNHYIKYKIYNEADIAQSISIDMDDEGDNVLQSWYMKFNSSAADTTTVTSFNTLTNNLTTTAFDTNTIYNSLYDTVYKVFGTDRTTSTSKLTSTVTYPMTKQETVVVTNTIITYNTKFDTSLESLTSLQTSATTIFQTATLFLLKDIEYQSTIYVTSRNTSYGTNKTTTTTINSGTALITSVDTDTIFDTIVTTDVNTEPA